jgi:ribonuclease BN (tRNA processing enzyme)
VTRIHVLGCSDAFSSGGRLFPSFYVETGTFRFLLDCGPTAVLGMKRAGIDPDSLDAVLLSHFHGDHYAGLPFLEIELDILHNRKRPLTVGGPKGVAEKVRAISSDAYPSEDAGQRIDYHFIEWEDDQPVDIGPLRVEAVPVVHAPESQPHGLRIHVDGRILAYSGDSEWCDALPRIAANADLFICESLTFSREVKNHLSYASLDAHRSELTCQRLLITHMSDDMLRNLPVHGADTAFDGQVIDL